MPAGVSLVPEHPGRITARILRLTRLAMAQRGRRDGHLCVLKLTPAIRLTVFLPAAAVVLSFGDPLTAIHAGL
jgi:hypothetical protein